MLMVKNRNGISLSHYQRPIILPNTERFVGEEAKPQKKHEVTTAKCDLSPPSLTSTTQLRVWIFPLHPQSGIWKRTCTCQINWITARDGPQSTGRWQTSKISLIPHRSTPCCCTHLISGTWIICAQCLHTHTHTHSMPTHSKDTTWKNSLPVQQRPQLEVAETKWSVSKATLGRETFQHQFKTLIFRYSKSCSKISSKTCHTHLHIFKY